MLLTVNITYPQVWTFQLHKWYDQQKQADHNGSLHSESLQCPVLRRPRYLEIGHAEAPESACKVNECRNLALQEKKLEIGQWRHLQWCPTIRTLICGKQSLQYASITHVSVSFKGMNNNSSIQMATVLIITATSAIPHPITSAPTLKWFWKLAPSTIKPQMYNGIAI